MLIHVDLKVIPGSSKNEFAGVGDNRLRIKIAAPPEDGKANDSLRAFLAKSLGCPKKDVVLVKGEKSRLKTVALDSSCLPALKEIAPDGFMFNENM